MSCEDDDVYDDDDENKYFNLCESAAEEGCWDIVQLAWDHGCPCTDNIKLQCMQYQSTQHQKKLSDLKNQLQDIQQAL
jgi:hypothetical protein